MSRSKVFLGLGFALILAVLAAQSFSQDQAPPQRGRGGGRGGQGGQGAPGAQGAQMDRPGRMREGRDPEQMRQMMQERMMQRIKQNLGATDEQWTKIQPPLAKVMELSQQAEGPGMGMGSRMGMRGMGPRPAARPGAPEGMEEPPMPEPENIMEKARMELRGALDSNEAETIQKKLEAFRAARDEAAKELAAAKKELKGAVTLNQEAELVLMGYLD